MSFLIVENNAGQEELINIKTIRHITKRIFDNECLLLIVFDDKDYIPVSQIKGIVHPEMLLSVLEEWVKEV